MKPGSAAAVHVPHCVPSEVFQGWKFCFLSCFALWCWSCSPSQTRRLQTLCPMRFVPSAQLPPAPWEQLYPGRHSVTSANWVNELQTREAWTDPSFALITGALTGFPEESGLHGLCSCQESCLSHHCCLLLSPKLCNLQWRHQVNFPGTVTGR